MWGLRSTITRSRRPVYRGLSTARRPGPETSAGSPARRHAAGGPGFGTRSPPRRAPTRALAVCLSAATRLPTRGSANARPTSPVNSNSPSGRTPAPSAASASPSAAHHFLRGSVGRPGRAPRTLRAEGGPRHPAAAPGGCTRLSSASGCEDMKGRTLRGRPSRGRRGGGGPPLRDSGRPEAPPSGLGRGRSPGRRRSARLPGRGASGREPKGSGATAAPHNRCALEYLPIHGPDGRAHGAGTDGFTASGGRRRRQPGGSGDRQAAPLRSPAG